MLEQRGSRGPRYQRQRQHVTQRGHVCCVVAHILLETVSGGLLSHAAKPATAAGIDARDLRFRLQSAI